MYTSTCVPRTCCHRPRDFILWLRSLKSMQKTSGLKKFSDLLKELSDEAEHYKQVAKKYKRDPLHCAQLSGWPWVTFCRAILRSPSHGLDRVRHCCKLRACWCCYGLRAGLSWLCNCKSKRLERKVTKHEKVYTLPLAKRNSVNELVSKALTDKRISITEFSIITREVEKYHELKAAIRDGTTKTQETATQTQAPDLEKLKNELRKEVKQEFQKKISFLTAVSKSDLND